VAAGPYQRQQQLPVASLIASTSGAASTRWRQCRCPGKVSLQNQTQSDSYDGKKFQIKYFSPTFDGTLTLIRMAKDENALAMFEG
jgi:hypothetical protein